MCAQRVQNEPSEGAKNKHRLLPISQPPPTSTNGMMSNKFQNGRIQYCNQRAPQIEPKGEFSKSL